VVELYELQTHLKSQMNRTLTASISCKDLTMSLKFDMLLEHFFRLLSHASIVLVCHKTVTGMMIHRIT
jgi:hypothetical protein